MQTQEIRLLVASARGGAYTEFVPQCQTHCLEQQRKKV